MVEQSHKSMFWEEVTKKNKAKVCRKLIEKAYAERKKAIEKQMSDALMYGAGVMEIKPKKKELEFRGIDWAKNHNPNAAMIERDMVYSPRMAHGEAIVVDKSFKSTKEKVKSIPAACLRMPVENGLVLRYSFPVING